MLRWKSLSRLKGLIQEFNLKATREEDRAPEPKRMKLDTESVMANADDDEFENGSPEDDYDAVDEESNDSGESQNADAEFAEKAALGEVLHAAIIDESCIHTEGVELEHADIIAKVFFDLWSRIQTQEQFLLKL